jgi:hypothetical protein
VGIVIKWFSFYDLCKSFHCPVVETNAEISLAQGLSDRHAVGLKPAGALKRDDCFVCSASGQSSESLLKTKVGLTHGISSSLKSARRKLRLHPL